MSIIYVIMVYGMFGNVESMLPGSFPDLNACQAAVVQTHLTFGNIAKCEPLASKPSSRHYGRVRAKHPRHAGHAASST